MCLPRCVPSSSFRTVGRLVRFVMLVISYSASLSSPSTLHNAMNITTKYIPVFFSSLLCSVLLFLIPSWISVRWRNNKIKLQKLNSYSSFSLSLSSSTFHFIPYPYSFSLSLCLTQPLPSWTSVRWMFSVFCPCLTSEGTKTKGCIGDLVHIAASLCLEYRNLFFSFFVAVVPLIFTLRSDWEGESLCILTSRGSVLMGESLVWSLRCYWELFYRGCW